MAKQHSPASGALVGCLQWNGVLVTSEGPGPTVAPRDRYRGVAYGAPWPLAWDAAASLSPQDRALVAAVESLTLGGMAGPGQYAPALLADLALADQYAQCCQRHGLSVRALLCATPRHYPLLSQPWLDSLLARSRFLGYDYATSSFDFSALYSDLHPPPPGPLEELASRLNDRELFDDWKDLQRYVDARWRHIRATGERTTSWRSAQVRVTDLEDSGDFLPIEVRALMFPLADGT